MLTSTCFNQSTLPALLCHRATQTPTAVAYQFPELEQVVTWAQLWQQVQQMAAGLARQGIAPGDRVALLLEGRLELVVSLLGIVTIGAVAVPLNTYCKLAELRQYLLDAQPRALIIGSAGLRVGYADLVGAVCGPAGPVSEATWVPARVFVQGSGQELPAPFRPFTDLLGAVPTAAEMRALGTATVASAPAFLLYTAGTTGQPKGVLRSTASFLVAAAAAPRKPVGRLRAALLRHRDQYMNQFMVLSLLPLYHQGGLNSLLFLLESRNVPITLLTHFNPLTALRVAAQVRCRLLIATPYMVQAMLGAHPGAPAQLRSVWGVALGAAAVSGHMLDALLAKLPGLYMLMVGYGSSEAGVVATGTCFFGHNKNALVASLFSGLGRLGLLRGAVPYALFHQTPHSVCGRVAPHVEVCTLDPQTGQPLAAGQPGELAVRSPSVMPYASDGPTARPAHAWYRTGDIGYLTPDGVLILTDRLKRLISRGGEKISPTEVENAIRRHPGIADVYVVAVPDALYGEQACAMVVEQPGTRLEAAKLRAQLAGELSQFKIPHYVVCVPALPLLGSGKLAGEEIRQDALQYINSQAYA